MRKIVDLQEYIKRAIQYRKQKQEQMVSELLSFIIEGDSIGEACDKTMDMFPRDNLFIDGGAIEVFD